MAPWNLTDRMSSGAQRYFHLPVASDPAGGTDRPAVAPETYLIEEGAADGFPHLGVSVEDPSGAATGDGPLAAAVRLHAMAEGWLSYRPQRGDFRQCLILDLPPIWVNVAARVPWFERWVEADCLPRTVVYDNVDLTHLRELLEATPVSPTTDDRWYFPASVILDQMTKAAFIDRFLAGEPGHAMFAGRGAVIGRMNRMPGHATRRRLRLRAFYQDHTDAAPHPMRPRELFNLLFGIDSSEFVGHPLLRAIHKVGVDDNRVPVSNRMLLRPPLRTHARLLWEAEQELTQELTDAWGGNGSLQNRLLNGLSAFDHSEDYTGWNKCNVFVLEMLVRSGFRVMMGNYRMTPTTKALRYAVANHIVRAARRTTMTAKRPGLLGRKQKPEGAAAGKPEQSPWGRRWDEKLRTLPVVDRAPEINRMMREEGRAFYLALERQFTDREVKRSGHVMLLVTVGEDHPSDVVTFEADPPPGGWRRGLTKIGLERIDATVLEASGDGAARDERAITPYRSAAGADPGNDLLLIEALPGLDPDSAAGFANLCWIDDH